MVPNQVPGVITAIQVSGPASMVVGTTAQASAFAIQQGNILVGVVGDTPVATTFTWSSSNESRATVDANGLITAVAAGAVVITATAQGISGSCSFDVVTPTPTLVSLTITPDSPTVNISTTQQFSASALWDDGSTNVPPLTWDKTAGDGSIAATGIYTALGTAGTATIRVRDTDTLGISDTTGITISDPGGPVPIFSVDWNDYADIDAVADAWSGTGPFSRNLGGWPAPNGLAPYFSDYRREAYSLEADTTYGKALKCPILGRDLYAIPITTSGSTPTFRVTANLPASYPKLWQSRTFRYGKQSDRPVGGTSVGFTTVGDGTSHSYKQMMDRYAPKNAHSSDQMRVTYQNTAQMFADFHATNSAGATETKLSQYPNPNAGVVRNFSFPTTATNDEDGWFQVLTYFNRISSTEEVLGLAIRKTHKLDGTPLAATQGTAGEWRWTFWRYTNIPGSGAAGGIDFISHGLNTNSSFPHTQHVFLGPWEAIDASQYADPYGILALTGVTP